MVLRLARNTLDTNIELLSRLHAEINWLLNFSLLVHTYLKTIVLDKVLKSSYKIKAVVSLRELQSYVSLLSSLLVDYQKGKETGRIDAPLDVGLVVMSAEGGLRKLRVVLVNQLDDAFLRVD